jgi:molybdopterin biosynthesis enzyme MoaB
VNIKDFRDDFVEAVNNVIKKHLKGFEKGLKNLEVK